MFNLKNRLKAHAKTHIRRIFPQADPYNPRLYGDSYWYEGTNLWEPPVIIALKDLCKPGTIVFDVGGNLGGLTSAMSRLVGPKGTVCTFEASPRIIGYLQQNVVKQGHHNVTVYHRAIYSRSNEVITIYDGDHLNDSIYAKNSPSKNGHAIKTLALDDFCTATGLMPDLIKMDIEGAEFDALQGAAKMIEKSHPHLLLEQEVADTRCLNFLIELGYIAIDLNTYKQVKSAADYPPGTGLRNVAFLHPDRISSTPYKLPLTTTTVRRLEAGDFRRNERHCRTSIDVMLEPGRYLMDTDFTARGTDNNMMCGVRSGGLPIFRYHTYTKFMASDYRDWVVDVPHRMNVVIYFDFLDGTNDPSFNLKGVTIRKLENLAPSLWPSLAMD